MNSTLHSIETTIFDISYHNDEHCTEYKNTVEKYISGSLVDVIDEVFGEIYKLGSDFNIEHIEIDLGEIYYQDCMEELPRRLKQYLLHYFYDMRFITRMKSKISSKEYTLLDETNHHLLEYLQNGYLCDDNVFSASANDSNLNNVIYDYITNFPQTFKIFFEKNRQNDHVIPRLVNQLSEDGLLNIVALYYPQKVKFTREYFTKFRDLFIADKLELPHCNTDVCRLDYAENMLWRILFQYLSSYNFHTRSLEYWLENALLSLFVEKMMISKHSLATLCHSNCFSNNSNSIDNLLRLKRASNISGVDIIDPNELDDIDEIAHIEALIDNRLTDCKANAYGLEISNITDVEFSYKSRSLESPSSNYDAHISKFIEILESGNISDLDKYWSILKSYPWQLNFELRNLCQRKDIRWVIASKFNTTIKHELLVLLEPSEYQFVEIVVEQIEECSSNIVGQQYLSSVSKIKVWEFSLAFIVIERGSEFNRKSYLMSIFSQMAISENICQSELATVMLDLLIDIPTSTKYKKELSKLLFEISTNINSESLLLKNELTTSAHQNYPTKSHEYYDILIACLDSPEQMEISESIIRAALDHLYHNTPWLLTKYYREIGYENSGQQRVIINNCSNELLFSFIRSFLLLKHSSSSSYISDFLTDIEKNSFNAKNIKSYYCYLFQCLLDDKNIDLLNATQYNDFSHIDEEGFVIDKVNDKTNDKWRKYIDERNSFLNDSNVVSDPVNNSNDALKVAQTFLGELIKNRQVSLNADAQLLLVSSFTYITRFDPNYLRFVIFEGLKNKYFVRHIVQTLPDSLQVHIISLVNPLYYSMILITEFLLMASKEKTTEFSREQIDEMKWRFIYRYIDNSGLRFNEKQYFYQFISEFLIVFKFDNYVEYCDYLTSLISKHRSSSDKHLIQHIVNILTIMKNNKKSQIFAHIQNRDISNNSNTGQHGEISYFVQDNFKQAKFEQNRDELSIEGTGKGLLSKEEVSYIKQSKIQISGTEESKNEQGSFSKLTQVLPTSIITNKQIRGLHELPHLSSTILNHSSLSKVDSKPTVTHIKIHNAGIVLLVPYLTRLFNLFNFIEKNQFNDFNDQQKAVHLLQYLIREEEYNPEFILVINKILCGIGVNIPIMNGYQLTEVQKDQIDEMLQAVISHWSVLGNTSIDGFRESFLQRDGYLILEDNTWRLNVHEKSYDMLLDQLPWAYSPIKFPWMKRPIHVSWR